MSRILFVDDEVNVLQGLRRMLHGKRHDWDMEFAASGGEALQILTERPFDLLVSDMRMPGMDGAQLLAEARHRWPHMVRVVLSGQADQDALVRSIGLTHQYLSKPCDADTLIGVLSRACRLTGLSAQLLADEKLKDLVSTMDSLPSLPFLYAELLQECQNPNGSLDRVARIISQDVGMVAKILQVLNSAFFGARRTISSPLQAVQLLGLDTIRALVLASHVFSQFKAPRVSGFSVEALWNHSMTVSALARQISALEGAGREATDEASIAGLLHDAGKLVLATNLPEQFGRAIARAHEQRIPLTTAEFDLLGETHAGVGAYLLALWALPDSIVEAAAFHHVPARADRCAFGPLTAVHVANALASEAGHQEASDGGIDRAYLEALSLSGRLEVWRHHQASQQQGAA